jgi:hypothetical protein
MRCNIAIKDISGLGLTFTYIRNYGLLVPFLIRDDIKNVTDDRGGV